MKVSEIMTPDLGVVDELASVKLIEILRQTMDVRHFPVKNQDGSLVGLVTIRDIVESLAASSIDFDIEVGDIMSTEVCSVDVDVDIKEVAKLMAKKQVSCIPVESEEKLVGIVTERDVVKYFASICD